MGKCIFAKIFKSMMEIKKKRQLFFVAFTENSLNLIGLKRQNFKSDINVEFHEPQKKFNV